MRCSEQRHRALGESARSRCRLSGLPSLRPVSRVAELGSLSCFTPGMKTFQKIALYTVAGGAILGGIGFVGGFFGPIIFTPQANQGPLLGIFITGPLGFILGAIVGLIVGVIRSAKKP